MKDDGENVEFFRGLVEWSEGDTCFFTNYWTWAEHTGDAIERFRTYARSIGIDDLFIVGIEPFDHEALPEETISGDNNIFVSDTAHGAPRSRRSGFHTASPCPWRKDLMTPTSLL